MKSKRVENDDIIYITGNRKDIVLRDGDKVNLDFKVNFEIEVVKSLGKNEIIVKDVEIKRKEIITKENE